jgi:hypothetical protein
VGVGVLMSQGGVDGESEKAGVSLIRGRGGEGLLCLLRDFGDEEPLGVDNEVSEDTRVSSVV